MKEEALQNLEEGDDDPNDTWTSGIAHAPFQWGDYVVWRHSDMWGQKGAKQYFHGTVVGRHTDGFWSTPVYTLANVVNGKIVKIKIKNDLGTTRMVVTTYGARRASIKADPNFKESDMEISEDSYSESSEESDSEISEESYNESSEEIDSYASTRRRLSPRDCPIMHRLMDQIEEQK